MRLGKRVAEIDLDEVQSAECLFFFVAPGRYVTK